MARLTLVVAKDLDRVRRKRIIKISACVTAGLCVVAGIIVLAALLARNRARADGSDAIKGSPPGGAINH